MTAVLVCGGRDFNERGIVFDTLDRLKAERQISTVIHGCAPGADTQAEIWGVTRGMKMRRFPADWKTNGRAAGPIRNALMLSQGKPDLVVAFPGGRGTADMVAKAKAAGIEVIEVSL